MCGIFGHYSFGFKSISKEQVVAMGKAILHRGPDGQGLYYDETVSLGNRRLAILDVEHGAQPFVSDDGNIVVVQNGEIFNHVELAHELAKSNFHCKTQCDTEVILRLYEKEGIDGISKLNGMFAIVILDKKLDSIYLVRDRVGEKPFFYYLDDHNLVYASEIKAILAAVEQPSINPQAIDQFFAFNYIPSPITIFDKIFHVEPGHYIQVNRSGIKKCKWWDLSQVKVEEKSEQEWIESFNSTLDDAVRIRLRSDVPFGAFLSGGVDSSCIVGLMAGHLNNPVKTYSIGFDDDRYDESRFAQEAADRFATEHHMQKVDPNMLDLWEKVLFHCDQPHGDVSFMPTYRVAEMASKDVKMVLTGDGADELFAGYDKYLEYFSSDSDQDFEVSYCNQLALFPKAKREKLFTKELSDQLKGDVNVERLKPLFEEAKGMDNVNKALYIDTMLLLSGNNLVKPDRAGMAVSIENRAPFLDYRIIEMAFSMPGSLKLKNGETKYIYKKAVSGLIGERLAYRKKQMFTVPIGEWFRTKLRPLCVDLLLSDRTIARGFFNYEYVRELLDIHMEGNGNNTREIRALMAFEIWCRKFLD